MAKDKLTEYDATAANNTVVGDVNLAENSCLPSDLNNAVREVMSHLKAFSDGTDAIDALTVTGDLTVDTNTLHVDAANNRVGVGTISPATALDVTGTVTADGIDVDGASILGTPGTFYVGDDGGAVGAFLNQTASLPLRLMTAGAERMRVLSGGGLTFNGDTAAANALDDYEEGTWTPTYTRASSNPTVTYTGTTGSYVKVGKVVTLGGRISTTAVSGGSGSYHLGGLPFTVENTTDDNFSLIVGVSFSTWPANQAPAGGYALRNQTEVALKTFNGDDARDGLDTSISSLTASGTGNGLVFSLTYRVA